MNTPPRQRSSFFDVKIALSTLTDVAICLTDKSVGAALSGTNKKSIFRENFE